MVNKSLKEYREKQNISVADIAKKLSISKVYYWQIENGKRNLYYNLAIKIAKVLKTKPDKLFYEYYKLP